MALHLENRLSIDLPRSTAWDLLLDVERMARCIPGAELTEKIDNKIFRGNLHVKFGPVALVFSGRAELTSIDRSVWSVLLVGAGDEKKGRGQAKAKVTFRLIETTSASTDVVVESDVTLTGSVAQYGRGAGMISALAEEIVRQFSENLRRDISESSAHLPSSFGPNRTLPRAISGLALAWSLIRTWLARTFGRSQRAL